MNTDDINIVDTIAVLNNIIYKHSKPTVLNAFEYEICNSKQVICFNNKNIEINRDGNTIVNPENVCRYIHLGTQERLINVRYIPQNNKNVIKFK